MRRNGTQPPRHQDTKMTRRRTMGVLSWCPLCVFVSLWCVTLAGCKAYDDVPPAGLVPVVCPPVTEPGAEPCWEPPVAVHAWRYIVVHHSATPGGSAALFEKYHREQRHWENGMGYHFVIGNGVDVADGLVEVGDRWVRQIQGAHVGGDFNKECIGICLVGDFSQKRPSARQMASLDRLVRFLMARCGVPASRVIGHCEARPGHTVCPGRYFSMDALRKSLSGSTVCQLPTQSELETGVPAGGAPPPPPAPAQPQIQSAQSKPANNAQGFRIYGSVRSLR